MTRRAYLGDGCYVEVLSGGVLLLTTENGISVTNRIVLEPETFHALVAFASAPEMARGLDGQGRDKAKVYECDLCGGACEFPTSEDARTVEEEG